MTKLSLFILNQPPPMQCAAPGNSGPPFINESQQDLIHAISRRANESSRIRGSWREGREGTGTKHAPQSLPGFFTRFGDGGADVSPLPGQNNRRVRSVAKALDAQEELAQKGAVPRPKMLRPLRPNEDAYGIPFNPNDDFPEGKPVSDTARDDVLRINIDIRDKRVALHAVRVADAGRWRMKRYGQQRA